MAGARALTPLIAAASLELGARRRRKARRRRRPRIRTRAEAKRDFTPASRIGAAAGAGARHLAAPADAPRRPRPPICRDCWRRPRSITRATLAGGDALASAVDDPLQRARAGMDRVEVGAAPRRRSARGVRRRASRLARPEPGSAPSRRRRCITATPRRGSRRRASSPTIRRARRAASWLWRARFAPAIPTRRPRWCARCGGTAISTAGPNAPCSANSPAC